MFHVFGLFLPAASTANGPVQSAIEAAATANTFLVFWLTRCLVFWNRCTIRRRRRPRLGWSGIILFVVVVVDDDVVVVVSASFWRLRKWNDDRDEIDSCLLLCGITKASFLCQKVEVSTKSKSIRKGRLVIIMMEFVLFFCCCCCDSLFVIVVLVVTVVAV